MDGTLWERLLFELLPLLQLGDYGIQLFFHPVPLFLDLPAKDHQRSQPHSLHSNQEQGRDAGRHVKAAQPGHQVDEENKSKMTATVFIGPTPFATPIFASALLGALLNVI